jgi:hypothetical protein
MWNLAAYLRSNFNREVLLFHVGFDIHSTRITIYVLNETGQVVHRSRVPRLRHKKPTSYRNSSQWRQCR